MGPGTETGQSDRRKNGAEESGITARRWRPGYTHELCGVYNYVGRHYGWPRAMHS